MQTQSPGTQNVIASRSTLLVLGFAAIGAFSFGLACVALLLRPDTLSGDPVRGPVLALTHLVTLGWIASFLFAGAYLVGPLLAGSPLWSSRLPFFHLLCHVVGLMFLLGGLAVQQYQTASIGAGIICLGLLALIVNLLVTASRRSLWNPANLGFQTSMFWLAVTGAIALFMLRTRLVGPSPSIATETLIALHANGALFGFLAQALLAVSLKIIPALLGLDQPPRWVDRLGWTGWTLLNIGVLMFPLAAMEQPGVIWLIGIPIALGVTGFAAQMLVYFFLPGARWNWGALTHAVGILLLVLIVVGALGGFPRGQETTIESIRSWIRLYISLALLGPFAFAILGTGIGFVPRLVWRLRFGPWAKVTQVPPVSTLSQPAGGGPMFFSLLMGWVYLYMGQTDQAPSSTRIGAILLLLAFHWFLVGVFPALLRLAVGVTPDDLHGVDVSIAGAPHPLQSSPVPPYQELGHETRS